MATSISMMSNRGSDSPSTKIHSNASQSSNNSGETMSKQRVALLGTGTMGSGMARNLRKAGFPLTVYNRTRERAEQLAETGAQIADTPSQAVADAAVVLSILADDDASRAAWLGPNGALPAMQAGSVVIECGTVSPEWVKQLHDEAQTRGLRMMDAPVTGSRP